MYSRRLVGLIRYLGDVRLVGYQAWKAMFMWFEISLNSGEELDHL